MMYATAVVLLFCSVVALGLSCCTPDQWEAQEGVIGGFAGRKRHGLVQEYIEVAYDATNQRTAAFVDVHSGEYCNKYKVVTRYDSDGKGKLYVYDLKKDKCWTKTLDRPFRKACIPSEAKSFGSYFLGLSGGFNVTGYQVGGERIQAFVSVQEIGNDQCIPVSEAVFGKVRNVDFLQNVGFINVSPGIRNETIFHIPRKCERMEDTSMAEEFTRDHYILAI
jgi:hypothetical protein